MLTNEEAKYLLALEKSLINPTQVIDLREKKNRIELFSHEDLNQKFWIEITTNQKIILKTSIHHLEANGFEGLLRIDFKGGLHKNPEVINEYVPDYLKKYAGVWIQPSQPHMHFFVQGYKNLVWAIPLDDTDFKIKTLDSSSDNAGLIYNFAIKINLTSKLNIQSAIL